MQEHIPVINEQSLHGQFKDEEIAAVLTNLKNVILQGRQHGFSTTQKVLTSSAFLEKEIAPGTVLCQWIFNKWENDPYRDIKAYFIQVLGGRGFIDDFESLNNIEYIFEGENVLGLGYAHFHDQPCFAFPEKKDNDSFCIHILQQNLLQSDASIKSKNVYVGVISKMDGFDDLRMALVRCLQDANNDISGSVIHKQAWFCFPNLIFSKEAISDLQNITSSYSAWRTMIRHLHDIDVSVYDFAHKISGKADSFLQILTQRCNASDENDKTKNDMRSAQNHCFFFPSLGQSRYCFLHTKYADYKRIYFDHDPSLHKAYIGKLNVHLLT